MALELEGKIIRKLDVQSGTSARGTWAKQEFILEYQEGNFPSQACLNVWGEDKVRDLGKFQVGDTVKVSFNVSSREYNGRWYTDLRAWKIEAQGRQEVAPPPTPPVPPAPTIDDMPGETDDDDLPFL